MRKAIVVIRPPTSQGSAALPELTRRAAEEASRLCGCVLNLPAPPASGADALAAVVELYAEGEDVLASAAQSLCDRAGALARADAYLVSERVPVAYERTWADRVPSPGVRMLSLCHRRAGTTREEFDAYWRDHHTAVACGFTVPIWNYSQNVVVRALTPGAPEVDGLAGLHFRSFEEWTDRYVNHPDEAARGAEDARRFMDLARGETLFAVEEILSTFRGARPGPFATTSTEVPVR
jgi:hypothetical protein